MADQRVRQVKIKTGVVKRLTKECVYYGKEAEKEKERCDKMKKEGADEYQLKKQNEVVQESLAMIPDTKRRLQNSKDDLKKTLENEKDLEETEEYKDAVKILAEADKLDEEDK